MSEPTAPAMAEANYLKSQQTTLSGEPGKALAKTESSDGTLADAPIVIAEEDKPKGIQFALIMVGLYLTVYINCLDVSIIAPALPVITNEFKDTSKATWYFSIFLAANCAFQPICGPFYRFSPKWTFLISVFIFELGSLLCAVANSSELFIFGRAVAGAGAAGSYIGVMTIIALICAPHEQVKYSNGVGALYTLGAVSGPLIGGAFTSHVSWRWCFYINLPLGGLTLAFCFFFLKIKPSTPITEPFKTRFIRCLKEVDWVGLALLFGAVIELLFALQEGGINSPWSSPKVIGCLVGAAATILVLCVWVLYRGENGYIRPRLLKQRTMVTAILLNFAIAGAYFTVISVLAYYFEIRGSSSLRAGVQLLPLIAGVCLGLLIGGIVVPILGYVNAPLLFGLIVFTIGLGLFTLFDESTGTAFWAGIQIFSGFGAGLAFMLPFIASQTVLAAHDIEIGTAMVLFSQTLGGALIFGAGQAWFQNLYLRNIQNIPGLENARTIALSGVTAFRDQAPAEYVQQIETIAIDALRHTYYIPAGVLAVSILLVWPFLEWNSVKPPPKKGSSEEIAAKEKALA